jgi:hypothetical protein
VTIHPRGTPGLRPLPPGAASIQSLLDANAASARTGQAKQVGPGATPPYPYFSREAIRQRREQLRDPSREPIDVPVSGLLALPIGMSMGGTQVVTATRAATGVGLKLLRFTETGFATPEFIAATQHYRAYRLITQGVGWANRLANVDIGKVQQRVGSLLLPQAPGDRTSPRADFPTLTYFHRYGDLNAIGLVGGGVRDSRSASQPPSRGAKVIPLKNLSRPPGRTFYDQPSFWRK